MKNLTTKDVIQNAINEIDFESLISTKITEEVQKAVKSAVENLFMYSGPIKKQIEEEFKSIGHLNLDKLGVDGLSVLMSNAIIEATNELIVSETKESVQKHMFKGLTDVSKINDINAIVEQVAESLGERDYGDDSISGCITISYTEESSRYSDYVHKYWVVSIEDAEGVDDESVKFCVSHARVGRIYHIEESRNIDKLSEIVDALKKIETLGLEVKVVDESYSFNNYES